MAKCKLIRSSIPAEITFENMHLAWTNPNPTTDFGTQEITLNTDGDYDFVRYEFLNGRSYATPRNLSMDVQKGENTDLACPALNGSASYTTQYLRVVTQTSDTKVTFMDCYAQNSNGTRTTNNSFCIPTKIWVYKKNPTAKVTAIASSVKTNAQNCMMSDGVTSVEDAINRGSVSVTADGVKNYTQLLNALFAITDKSKITNDSIFVFRYNDSNNTKAYFHITESSNNYLVYARLSASSSGTRATEFYLETSSSKYQISTGSTRSDSSTQVPTSGWSFEIFY